LLMPAVIRARSCMTAAAAANFCVIRPFLEQGVPFPHLAAGDTPVRHGMHGHGSMVKSVSF